MVPLNFGATTPFRAKLHLEQVSATSGFCVPQFGQNTRPPPRGSIAARDPASQAPTAPRAKRVPCLDTQARSPLAFAPVSPCYRAVRRVSFEKRPRPREATPL